MPSADDIIPLVHVSLMMTWIFHVWIFHDFLKESEIVFCWSSNCRWWWWWKIWKFWTSTVYEHICLYVHILDMHMHTHDARTIRFNQLRGTGQFPGRRWSSDWSSSWHTIPVGTPSAAGREEVSAMLMIEVVMKLSKSSRTYSTTRQGHHKTCVLSLIELDMHCIVFFHKKQLDGDIWYLVQNAMSPKPTWFACKPSQWSPSSLHPCFPLNSNPLFWSVVGQDFQKSAGSNRWEAGLRFEKGVVPAPNISWSAIVTSWQRDNVWFAKAPRWVWMVQYKIFRWRASSCKFHRNSMWWPFNFIHNVLVSVFTWFVGIVSVLSCCVTLYSFVLLMTYRLMTRIISIPIVPIISSSSSSSSSFSSPSSSSLEKNLYIVIIYHDHRFINLSLIIVFLELFPGTSLDFTLFADHGIVNPHEQVFQRPFGRRQTSSRPEQDGLSSWFWVQCVYTCSNDSTKHIKVHQIICKQSSANPQTESIIIYDYIYIYCIYNLYNYYI